MKIRYTIKALFIILFASSLLTTAAASDPIFTDCDGCSNAAMKSKAIEVAPYNSGYTDVNVYNFTDDKIHKYQVLKETEPGHEWTHVIDGNVEPDVQQDFDKAVHVIQTFQIPVSIRPVPVQQFDTAFEVVQDSNAQNDLVDIMVDHYGIIWIGKWLSGSFITVTPVLANMMIVVKFEFPDGSEALFELINFDPTSLSVSLQFHSGTDADGNEIHLTSQGYLGDSGTVHPDNKGPFVEYLWMLGFDTIESSTCGVGDCDWFCPTTSQCELLCPVIC